MQRQRKPVAVESAPQECDILIDVPETHGTKGGRNASWWELLRRALCYLLEHEDGSYLAPFRILWGIIMFDEIWQLIANDYDRLVVRYYLNIFLSTGFVSYLLM